ncbi:MAG TPA: TonB-dependent receptor [Steroidobacteraceae bacterium]|jgi:outer membrane receptor protein involved in Fe transport
MKGTPGLVATIGLCSLVGAASAADTTGMPNEDQTSLSEIIVIAQKRTENLQDVPIAISAVSGKQLAATAADNITAIADMTPALQMNTNQGSLQPHIRGVGSNIPDAENSVAMYLDGVYVASPSAALLSLNNIQQVETLKGPQGTLFGRNATGGALLVETRDPTPSLSSNMDVSYGNFQTVMFNGYVADGLAPGLAADVAMHVSHQGEGYGRNLDTGSEIYQTNLDLAVRSKWLWTPGEADTVHLIFDYTRRYGSSASPDYIPRGTYPSVLEYPTVTSPVPRPYDINTFLDPSDSLDSGGISARIDHTMSWAKLVSISAYRQQSFDVQFDITLTPATSIRVPLPFPPFAEIVPLPTVNALAKDKQISQEFQLVSPNDSKLRWLTWVAGLYYFHDKEEQVNSFSAVATDSYSGFGEAHVEFMPATHLTLGLRYTDEEKELSVSSGYTGALTPEPTSWFSQLTYRLGLDHKFDNGTLVYVSRNLGFKSGGYNSTQPSLPNYAPEILKAWEAGAKTELLDHRVRLNGAAFYYDYTGIQLTKLTTSNQVQYYNGPAAKSYGADLDLQAQVSQAFRIDLGASYIHARFTSDTPSVQYNVPNPAFPGGSTPSFSSADGNQLPDTPEWTASVGFNYLIPTARGDFTLDGQYLRNSGFYGEADNQLRQPAYDNLNAALHWHVNNGPFTVGLWCRNATNSLVYTAVAGNFLASLAQYVPPRTYGIQFSAQL